jgi:PAS domain S-box-containing protein
MAVIAGIWFVSERPREMLFAAFGLLLAAVSVIAFLLYRQTRARRAALQALESMQARASGFSESAMDPIISIDDGQRIVMFNAAAEQAFRWPCAAVLGQPLDMLIPQRFHAGHRAHVDRFRETGVSSRRMGGLNALTGVRSNGEEFPIEASISQHVEDGRKVLTVVLRDVTERMRSEALLSRSEGRLRGILDSAMDAIVTVDERQKIVIFNAAAEQMFGCPQEQAIGAPLAWFIPDRFRAAHVGHIEAFGSAGVTTRRMAGSRVVMGLRRNGEEFPIDASISQLSDGGSKFYTVILRDVSERVRALESLAQSKDELRELASAASASREQEQARIARELHDELGQAMAMLKMDISMIRSRSTGQDTSLASRLDRMEAQINTTIGAMRRIAADLRPLTLDDLGLAAAIESLVHDFERRSGVRCKLAAQTQLDIPPGHATAVFRIVQEALTNVSKHAMASNVEVIISTADKQLTVVVRDDGIGFASDGPRKPQSYGLLGVRERAYLLGGQTRIASMPGRGTEIEVRLPAASSA